MSGLPIPTSLLKPFLEQGLKIAQDKAGKGNPLVGTVLTAISGLLDGQPGGVPREVAPLKQQISASLAADFAAMDKAAGKAVDAGRFKG